MYKYIFGKDNFMAKTNKNANYVTDKTQVAQKQAAKAKSSQKTKEIAKQVLLIAAIVIAVAAVITGFVFWMMGISQVDEREFKAPVPGNFEVTDTVELEFEGYGKVKIELYGKEAPKTVENFLHLVEHGDLAKDLITISTTTTNNYITIAPEHDHSDENHEHEYIKGEFYSNGVANKISHVAGVLTMNTGSTAYNSSGTDFKILTGDYSADYNGKYAAFGKVTDGGLAIIQDMVKDYREKASSSSSSSSASESDLVFGDNKLTIKASDIEKDTIDYTFIPTVSGKYTFKHTADKKFVSITLVAGKASDGAKSAEFGTEITTLKDGVEFELTKGETYTATLKFHEDAAAGTYLLTIDADILFVGKNEVEITEEQIQGNNDISFNFTANMTGIHTFIDKDEDLEELIEIFDGETSLGKNSAYLEEGKTYTVVISANDDIEADDYEITVTEPVIVIGDNKLEVPEYTIRDGKAYYYFTADNDAKYLFVNKDLTFKVYDKEGNLLEGGSYVDLKKGETYRVELIAELIPELLVGANTVKLEEANKLADKAIYEKEYTFTANSTGKYTLTATNVTFKIYNGTKEVAKADDGTYSLTAGKTYKVMASCASVGDYALEISVADPTDTKEVITTKSYTVTVQDPILAVGSNGMTITEADITNGEVKYTFVATTNGPFSFVAKYPLLDKDGKPVKDSNGSNQIVNLTSSLEIYKGETKLNNEYAMLEKGETYTVVIKTSKLSADTLVTITISKIAPKLVGATKLEKAA